jgi:hypothetical protein
MDGIVFDAVARADLDDGDLFSAGIVSRQYEIKRLQGNSWQAATYLEGRPRQQLPKEKFGLTR